MATADERKALGFLLMLTLVGGGVRWVGVQTFERDVLGANRLPARLPAGSGSARALDAQIAAIDSARRNPKAARKPSKAKGPRQTKATTSSASRDDMAPTNPPRRPPPDPPPRLDVNAATVAELERLPRVGPALAQRIVAYRERHGPFESAEALRHVRGIGPSTVHLLEPLVTFSGRHRP